MSSDCSSPCSQCQRQGAEKCAGLSLLFQQGGMHFSGTEFITGRMCHSPYQKPLSAPSNSLNKHPKFMTVSCALQEKAPQPLSFLFSHPSDLVSKALDKQLPLNSSCLQHIQGMEITRQEKPRGALPILAPTFHMQSSPRVSDVGSKGKGW